MIKKLFQIRQKKAESLERLTIKDFDGDEKGGAVFQN